MGTEVLHLPKNLFMVLLLIESQVCCVALQTPRHVVRQIVECETGLLFGGGKVRHSFGGEFLEARVCEWCESEERALRVLCVDDGAVLKKHHTQPAKELQELFEGDIPAELRLACPSFEGGLLLLDPGKDICKEVSRRLCRM